MMDRVWTISNILSLLRIALVGPIIAALLENSPAGNLTAGLLVFAAAATDFFDGLLARRLNQISEFGKIVDPVADKIAVLGVAAVLVHLGRVPLWFFGVAASRDMLILAGGLYARKYFGVTLQSTQTGKWCVAVTAAYILERILAPESPEWISALLAGA